jgi:predicted MFS family arabinose efflux permease
VPTRQQRAPRALALSSALVNLAGFLVLSISVLSMTQDLRLGADAVGLVFAAGGLGALLGSVISAPARKRWGARPLGSLAGGYLGSRIGLPATLVVGALGMLVAFLPLLASPIPRLRGLEGP